VQASRDFLSPHRSRSIPGQSFYVINSQELTLWCRGEPAPR
jgi:hypothetical protein